MSQTESEKAFLFSGYPIKFFFRGSLKGPLRCTRQGHSFLKGMLNGYITRSFLDPLKGALKIHLTEALGGLHIFCFRLNGFVREARKVKSTSKKGFGEVPKGIFYENI